MLSERGLTRVLLPLTLGLSSPDQDTEKTFSNNRSGSSPTYNLSDKLLSFMQQPTDKDEDRQGKAAQQEQQQTFKLNNGLLTTELSDLEAVGALEKQP
jgi:hypothetical protein